MIPKRRPETPFKRRTKLQAISPPFAGDEIKDVQCAKNAGAVSVLVNRGGEIKNYGQDYEIKDLREVIGLIG